MLDVSGWARFQRFSCLKSKSDWLNEGKQQEQFLGCTRTLSLFRILYCELAHWADRRVWLFSVAMVLKTGKMCPECAEQNRKSERWVARLLYVERKLVCQDFDQRNWVLAPQMKLHR